MAMLTNLILFPLAISFLGEIISSEKIIVFHHMASYSHRVQTWPLADALAKKGHSVTYIAPFRAKEPNLNNITEIVTPEHEQIIDERIERNFQLHTRLSGTMMTMLDFIFGMSIDVCETVITSPQFQAWLAENPKADLVIIDNCFPECGTGLAHKLGAKYIYFSTVNVFGHEPDMIGFPGELSAIPVMDTYPLKGPLTFLQRVSNEIESLKWRWEHYNYARRLDAIIRKELDIPDMPFVEDLLRNTSLVFYTGDVISDFPRALPPLYVNVAGIHARKSSNPLPAEMEKFISGGGSNATAENPDDGFIYISLGSMIISSNLPQHMKDIFFNVVRAFPHIKFLWKWNGPMPQEIPENLYLSKWFPQVDILGHPKIRGFVTQCGRPSLLEALYNGVPMISFPIVGDQAINADRMEKMGAMVNLDIGELNYDDLRNGVERILYDSELKARTKRLQHVFLDRPMTPVDTAVWWTEYVLRNEDTAHLRPAGNMQYWFVRRQVDVWATLSLGLFFAMTSLAFASWKLFSFYVKSSKKLKDE